MDDSLSALAEKLRDDRAERLQRLEFLVNSSPMAIYTCEPHGDFGATFVSAGIQALWGYEPEEFLSESGFWISRIHPDDATGVMGEIHRLFETERHSHEYRFRNKSGEYTWVHDELRLVRDASGRPLEIVGHCIDITARKAAEAALRDSESRLNLIFNSTSDFQVLFRVGPGNDFITEALNQTLAKRMKEIAGGDARDFIGQSFAALLAATGLTQQEIESRRSLYLKAAQDGKPVCFQSAATSLREPAEIWVYPIKDHSNRCTHLLWNGRVITERLKAEAALRESQERYALVTQATNDGIYDWNLATGASYLSPRFKEILGFRNEELSSEPAAFFDRIHPEDLRKSKEVRARIHKDPAFNHWTDEIRLKCRDGSDRWVNSRGTAIRDEAGKPIRIVGSISDMTERLEAAAKLAAQKKRLREIVNSLDGFVGLYTLEGIALEVNRASLNQGGYTSEEIVGKAIWETPWCRENPEEQARLRYGIALAAGGERVQLEAKPRSRDGHQMTITVTFSPLRDDAGTVTNIVACGFDISQLKEREAELRLAKKIAEVSSQAKSEFLANMSHEIRTPMNGIIGLTDVVLDSDLTAEQREYLNIVKTSAESLLNIISDILDISKLQTGKTILQPKEFWLKDMLNSTLKAFTAAAEEKKLTLTWEVALGVPEILLGDSGCLRQVLRNILGNAIKFTDHGEITMTVEPATEHAGLLRFSVHDTGVGVPPAKQRIIFEPFSQVDGSSRREFTGAGLGLAISAQLVEMMGGDIWVDSDGRKGSAFHFTVHMAAVSDNPAERRREIRLLTDGPAWLEIPGSPSAGRREVRIVDISKGGMKLRSAERLEAGAIVQIHMSELVGTAEICYSVASADGFLTGIRLLDG